MFALKNLPSLEPSPCGSLASVTASSAISVVPTAFKAIFAFVTASSAIVNEVEPVTSPVCVALLVLAVFAAIAVLI